MNIKPSKYVFRSNGLDTNTTRATNNMDKIAKKAIDTASTKLKLNNAKVANRKHELNLRNIKLRNDKTKRNLFSNSLANSGKNNLRQIKPIIMSKRPTYISTNNGDSVGK